jgi:SAM-dependent methyltransferase
MVHPGTQRQRQDAAFWERPETVAWFAARPPDRRLVDLLAGHPRGCRALDLGCAAGRHTVWLARAGFDVRALDASEAMVAHTRERLAGLLGHEEATARVHQGDMADLGAFAAGSFDLVIAIGVLPGAGSLVVWRRAVEEIGRVLRSGGELILTHFSPDPRTGDPPLEHLPAEPHLYRSRVDGRSLILLHRAELDGYLAGHGFDPRSETAAVPATTMNGPRTTLAGHFRKRSAAGAAKET